MPTKDNTKYIFVSGGVISGLGKGTATSAMALLVKGAGYRVSIIKADMYLNVDAGTMNPIEHGEVFVTDDGMETDQDVGNYERFLSRTLSKNSYMTMGQIYRDLIERERSLNFEGRTVQGHIHVPEEIITRITRTAKQDNAEVVFIEVGGTVGEYQNALFFEAIRRLKQKNPKNVFLVHLVYLITPSHLGEMKSKPAQASIYDLYKLGLSPDIVLCRSSQPIDEKRKHTISFNTGVPEENVFASPNAESVYEVPIIYKKQKLDARLLKIAGLKRKQKDLVEWTDFYNKLKSAKAVVRIGILGKYFKSGSFSLNDSYLCVIESIKHASAELGLKPEIVAIDVERFETNYKDACDEVSGLDGVIVPQGWGKRGVEGKLKAVQFVRENKIPFLGLCFGMQMSVIEYARNKAGMRGANSTEADENTKYPVIHVMPNQAEYLKAKQYGGTIRLGAWPCKLKPKTIISESYEKYAQKDVKNGVISERHRHRYEVNQKCIKALQDAGLVISGTSPDGKLVEAVELKKSDHPFFVGTQFHPEYKSWPLKPHPLFMAFLEASTRSRSIRLDKS